MHCGFIFLLFELLQAKIDRKFDFKLLFLHLTAYFCPVGSKGFTNFPFGDTIFS